MAFLSGALHLWGLVAPAFFVALVLWLGARIFMRRSKLALKAIYVILINFMVGVSVLFGGLLVFGRDGKMATYACLVFACASVQWILMQGWRR